MKKVIYSVITGCYDLLPVAPKADGWDVIMFTDYPVDEDCNGWQIRHLPKSDNPLLQSRDIKIRSHVHLPEYDLVCYIDGNQKLLKEPPHEPIWYQHARRTNIFDEAEQIIRNGRFPEDLIDSQIYYYITQGYEDSGLLLNGYFVRNNKDKDINRLHDAWYEETCRFSPRDQLSMPYAIWLTGVSPENIQPITDKEQYAIVTKGHPQKYYEGNKRIR